MTTRAKRQPARETPQGGPRKGNWSVGASTWIVRAKTALDTFWVNYQLNQLEAELDPDVFFRSRMTLHRYRTKAEA